MTHVGPTMEVANMSVGLVPYAAVIPDSDWLPTTRTAHLV